MLEEASAIAPSSNLEQEAWDAFLRCVHSKCSRTAYQNWIAPIIFVEMRHGIITLQVPNVFVKEYLLDNFKAELKAFLPQNSKGEPALKFVIGSIKAPQAAPAPATPKRECNFQLNHGYTFERFIEGSSNQFVKSAALGVAMRPGRSYNPFIIHGGVGLGKTHLLHAIAHHISIKQPQLKVHCLTTESFVNELVDHLKKKTIDKMKRFYRSLDVLLIDDIQFLQNRVNFEEEFCNTFEALINQNKQIVITSDKSPALLKMSERMIARMEWGLVAQVGMPDLETRAAILMHKAEVRGLPLEPSVAFYIAERVCSNVRQLEGVLNLLIAQHRLLQQSVDQTMVQHVLGGVAGVQSPIKVTADQVLKIVPPMLGVTLSDIRSTDRRQKYAQARQVVMYLLKTLVQEPLYVLAAYLGKTHSTVLHACKTVEKKMATNPSLMRLIHQARRRLEQEGGV